MPETWVMPSCVGVADVVLYVAVPEVPFQSPSHQVTTDPASVPLFAIVDGGRYLLREEGSRLTLKGLPEEATFEVEEVAELLSFSARWVRALLKRYNEGGVEALGDQRVHNGTKPTILTPEALAALKERIKMPPADGGLWTGPKIARWLARFHGVRSVHDQRGWDALIAIGYSIQQPRPRHPDAATDADRAALKKSLRRRLTRSSASIPARALKSGRWMNIASV